MPELGIDGLVLGIWTLSVEAQCCIACFLKFGALARDGQGLSKPLNFRPGVFGSNLRRGAYILCSERISMPRGTQMPYSAAVDLVAGLGASQMVSEHLGSILGSKRWILDKL
ncbi:hypothetical protein M9H77_21988 [Catharanthus roseus]|uniref:Uncharacterized protein n=1 Tax=Catharanthus roseus TaxID=4058 RepID=A0ACC0AP79_CATRO|nr:hypothetical protein M9H77_21988 [Catharanthus roseus]